MKTLALILLLLPMTVLAGSHSVSIYNYGFNPTSFTVNIGDTVTWTNSGSSHTVTADNGSFNSGNIGAGGSWTHVFSAIGTFPYHCAYHPMMVASVTVQEIAAVNTNDQSIIPTPSLKVIGNPVRDRVILEVTGVPDAPTVELYNAAGQLIQRLEGNGEGAITRYEWDARAAAEGMYFARLRLPTSDLIGRVMVER